MRALVISERAEADLREIWRGGAMTRSVKLELTATSTSSTTA